MRLHHLLRDSVATSAVIRSRDPRDATFRSEGASELALKSEIFVWSLLLWALVATVLVILPIH